ncbi:MAG TPA: Hsp20/alpha crystallin family protein, partial [Gemmatimonadaceae bacterium]|nr:Hsp20/alpha crystallin family protein [Gemmatimonadaceae bacterium]
MLNTRNLNTLDRMLTLDRVFDQAFGSSLGSRVWVPAMDVAERKDAYVVQAELPGLRPDQVDVSFEKNVLTIRGTKPASFDAAAEGELRIFAAERVSGTFERSVRLPEFVDAERITASVDNGVLTVTVPKA